ncbi:MAG TPA: DNA polymerase III subunit gamma/tau [Solirubrobacteraceae bacterium]|nr:DNA polymerase III subunit gamma/tau [Solirubrobacteraceae bacterium]
MSTSPSLYRRHRPRTFADLIGQEHVVRTLQNAVEQKKVHHAYLFVGSRGTGKTSMAKILAACLNCVDGPTTAPCGQCESCLAIANATSLDVIEMDAASNNSVDDIRDLRDKVGYAPVSGRHKVYILDEAHMLSPQAWNAFLKTLEEPPPRTIFVLATTEAQKVLPTVVDRCHRFDFARPSAEQVAAVLERVVGAEGIEAEAGALALVARHATGSFRDALGTLEQLVTYTGAGQIRSADVLAVLGVTDSEQLFDAVEAIAARDPARALRVAADLARSGRDPGRVLRDLEAHARDLLVVQVLDEVPAELRLYPERDQRLRAQAAALSRTDAVRLLDLIAAALEATANGAQARIQLELVLAKAAAPEVDPSVAALMSRIELLEGAVASAPSAIDVASVPQPEPAPEPEPAPAAPPEPPSNGTHDVDSAARAWPAVVDLIRADNAMLAALLEQARPVAVTEQELTLAFPDGAAFLKRKAEQEDHRRATVDALRAVTGNRLALRYELRELTVPGEGSSQDVLTGEELVQRFLEEFDAEEIIEEESH